MCPVPSIWPINPSLVTDLNHAEGPVPTVDNIPIGQLIRSPRPQRNPRRSRYIPAGGLPSWTIKHAYHRLRFPRFPVDLVEVWGPSSRGRSRQNHRLRRILHPPPLALLGIFNTTVYLSITTGFTSFDWALSVRTPCSSAQKSSITQDPARPTLSPVVAIECKYTPPNFHRFHSI